MVDLQEWSISFLNFRFGFDSRLGYKTERIGRTRFFLFCWNFEFYENSFAITEHNCCILRNLFRGGRDIPDVFAAKRQHRSKWR